MVMEFHVMPFQCIYVNTIKAHHESAQWLEHPTGVRACERVPGAKSCGQPIWLKLGSEVGCDEIFRKPLCLTSLTFSSGVTGGSHFLPFEHQKSSLPRIRPHW